MEYITAFNNYVVAQPNGDLIGFKELSDARSFISTYNLNNILENSPIAENAEKFFDLYQEKDQQDLGIITGVDEGECKIYDLEDFIEKVRESDFFESEKDEIISQLLKEDIKLNIYDYGIDNILTDVKMEWTV